MLIVYLSCWASGRGVGAAEGAVYLIVVNNANISDVVKLQSNCRGYWYLYFITDNLRTNRVHDLIWFQPFRLEHLSHLSTIIGNWWHRLSAWYHLKFILYIISCRKTLRSLTPTLSPSWLRAGDFFEWLMDGYITIATIFDPDRVEMLARILFHASEGSNVSQFTSDLTFCRCEFWWGQGAVLAGT